MTAFHATDWTYIGVSVFQHYSSSTIANICVYVNGASEDYECQQISMVAGDLSDISFYEVRIGTSLAGTLSEVYYQDFPLLLKEF
jgi:hypothetical protein